MSQKAQLLRDTMVAGSSSMSFNRAVRLRSVVLFVSASSMVACSLLTSLNDLGSDAGGSCSSPDFTCVPEPPPGWSGPFWIYDGDPMLKPASCPPSLSTVAVKGNATLLDASVGCTAPTCAVDAATCGSLAVEVGAGFGGNPCVLPMPAQQVDGSGGCYTANPHGGVVEYELEQGAATGCTVATDPIDGSFSWGTEMIGCTTTPNSTCSAGNVCLPTAPLPFEAKPCIYQMGNVSCPGAPYSNMRPTLFASTTLACTPFGCDCQISPTECKASINYAGENTSCGPSNVDVPPGTCTSLAADASAYFHVTQSLPPGLTCSLIAFADGGVCVGKGSASPSTPFTACCMP